MPNYTIESGLPSYPAGLTDKEVGLVLPLYRAVSNLSQKVSAATGNVTFSQAEMAVSDQFDKLLSANVNKIKVRAAVNISFGQAVNLYLDGTVVAARLANATDGTIPCHGVYDSPQLLTAGSWGEVTFMNGRLRGIGGTVFGARYFLSTTAGAVQISPPAAPGNLVQVLGVGLGSAGFYLQVVPGGA